MKSIELTEERKYKLLEMCNKLFPEYVNIQFQQIDFLQFSGKDNFYIHWFEFCITEIINELSWKNIKSNILADCEFEKFRMKLINEIFKDKNINEKFHIIDYLYEEFLKLK